VLQPGHGKETTLADVGVTWRSINADPRLLGFSHWGQKETHSRCPQPLWPLPSSGSPDSLAPEYRSHRQGRARWSPPVFGDSGRYSAPCGAQAPTCGLIVELSGEMSCRSEGSIYRRTRVGWPRGWHGCRIVSWGCDPRARSPRLLLLGFSELRRTLEVVESHHPIRCQDDLDCRVHPAPAASLK